MDTIREKFDEKLSEYVSDYFSPLSIGIVEHPNDIIFLREYVAAYRPCLLKGYIEQWLVLYDYIYVYTFLISFVVHDILTALS